MQTLLIMMIRFYQKFISPLTPPSCIYEPTCSTYMMNAIRQHGAIKGVIMGCARIGRCHPFSEGGHDPVPEKFSLKRNASRCHQHSIINK